jgi:hypothetical protein
MGIKKMTSLLEGLARTVEDLLSELRRRGAEVDVDTSDYDEYRAWHPKEDA